MAIHLSLQSIAAIVFEKNFWLQAQRHCLRSLKRFKHIKYLTSHKESLQQRFVIHFLGQFSCKLSKQNVQQN